MKTITHRVASWIMIFIGSAHMLYTFKIFEALKPDAIWFATTGLAIIFNGLFNLLILSSAGTGKLSFITLFSNTSSLIMLLLLCYVLPLPQVIILIIATLFATVIVLYNMISSMSKAQG